MRRSSPIDAPCSVYGCTALHLYTHLQLCFSRKPEYMGWGYWNNFWGAGSGEKRTDTEFSAAHYREADRRLAEYERIAARADSLMRALGDADRAACYQLLYYPVKGAQLMNRMHLTGQLYRQYVRQQRNAAARLKREAQVCLDSLQLLTDGYNALSGGKSYVLPTFPLHSERDFKMPEHTNSDTKYSVRIDNGSISTPASSAIEYSQAWYDSVLKNCRVNKSTLYVDRPGKHTLHIRCGDPGLVIQKIVIDMGGLKRSYLGPESTQCGE